MENKLTREQLIKQGARFQKMQAFSANIQNVFRNIQGKKIRQEVFIDTSFGKTRTLWYGFENHAKAPLFFDLHGGGFVVGTADIDEAMNLEFCKQVGCKIISIEYAKAPSNPFPTALNQIFAVVNHVVENADLYGIDTKKIAIGGHSAGANLSTVTCMKAKKEGKFQFACQVLDYPPLDLATSAFDKPQPKGCIPPKIALMFNACYVDPSEAKNPFVSPVYATIDDVKDLPPALFILAGMDSLHDEGKKYYELLTTAGVVAECYEYSNAVHGFTLNPSVDTTDAVSKMSEFLKRNLS